MLCSDREADLKGELYLACSGNKVIKRKVRAVGGFFPAKSTRRDTWKKGEVEEES